MESERLARRYFELFSARRLDELLELLDPEIEIALKTTRPGEVLTGRDEVASFVDELSERLWESVAEVYRPVDESRIVVEGRIRWTDDERVLRDDPMIWALEFRAGRLLRSSYAPTVLEAESVLAATRSDDRPRSP